MGEGVRAFNRATNEPTRIVDEKTRKEDEERKAILEAAKKLGIEVEGRDIRGIAQDIVKATQKIESEE